MTVIAPQATDGQGEWKTIGLVGLAHGTSHFFHLLLVEEEIGRAHV